MALKPEACYLSCEKTYKSQPTPFTTMHVDKPMQSWSTCALCSTWQHHPLSTFGQLWGQMRNTIAPSFTIFGTIHLQIGFNAIYIICNHLYVKSWYHLFKAIFMCVQLKGWGHFKTVFKSSSVCHEYPWRLRRHWELFWRSVISAWSLAFNGKCQEDGKKQMWALMKLNVSFF